MRSASLIRRGDGWTGLLIRIALVTLAISLLARAGSGDVPADHQIIAGTGTIVAAPHDVGDGFESGSLNRLAWTSAGDRKWRIVSGDAHSGRASARSGRIEAGERSDLSITCDVVDGSRCSFWLKVGSEQSGDHLVFSVDGISRRSWSGRMGWLRYEIGLSPGIHHLAWTYTKNDSVTVAPDAAWIDDLIITRARETASGLAPPAAGADLGADANRAPWAHRR